MPLFPDDHAGDIADDRTALERFRAGDPEILGAMYRAHLPHLDLMLRAGFRYSGGEGGAIGPIRDIALRDDLIHETFVKAFAPGARGSYDGLRPFQAWLRTIARNVTMKWYRQAWERRRGPSLEATVGYEVPQEASDWDTLEAEELAALVAAFVERLSAGDRQVLTLLFERNEGRITQTEGARQLGISHPTLRRRERKLLAELAAELQSHGYLDRALARAPQGATGAVIAAWALVIVIGEIA